MATAARGHTEVCRLLLDHLGSSQSAFMPHALRAASCANQVSVVDLLISRGIIGSSSRSISRFASTHIVLIVA